ncbi:MAG: DUF1360 domain-containing protein [bacterium]
MLVDWNAVAIVVLLAGACATMAMTLTKAVIFRGFREWVKTKSEFLGELFSCPYCTSHWIAGVLAVVFRPRMIVTNVVLDVIVSALVIIALTAPWCKLIFWSYSEIVGYEEDEEDDTV